MKQMILALSLICASPVAMASDWIELSKQIVMNMYGQPGDQYQVETFSNPNAFRVVISQTSPAYSAAYLVEVKDKRSVKPDQIIANIKVTYQGRAE
jgi:hypothetical protein